MAIITTDLDDLMCRACRGKGEYPGTDRTCRSCQGSGIEPDADKEACRLLQGWADEAETAFATAVLNNARKHLMLNTN